MNINCVLTNVESEAESSSQSQILLEKLWDFIGVSGFQISRNECSESMKERVDLESLQKRERSEVEFHAVRRIKAGSVCICIAVHVQCIHSNIRIAYLIS